LLLDGSFAVALHRDPSYLETAGEAAFSLTTAALSKLRKRAMMTIGCLDHTQAVAMKLRHR
jgi:hypothetical protein